MTVKQADNWKWIVSTFLSPVIAFVVAWGLMSERVTALEVQVKTMQKDIDIIQSDVKELLKTTQYEKSISDYQGYSEKRTANYSNSGASE